MSQANVHVMATFFLNRLTVDTAAVDVRLTVLRLHDIPDISEELLYAAASNYLWNERWFSAELGDHLASSKSGGILIAHDVHDVADLAKTLGPKWIGTRPTNLAPFGSMHSKFLFCLYRHKARLAILSNNYIPRDYERKTGSIWVQDFPEKPAVSASVASLPNVDRPTFEKDLFNYLEYLKRGNCRVDELMDALSHYDFSAACVHLISSVPGTHPVPRGTTATGTPGPRALGHLALRAALQLDCGVLSDGHVVAQYSSQGSIQNAFIEEFLRSCTGGAVHRLSGHGTILQSFAKAGTKRRHSSDDDEPSSSAATAQPTSTSSRDLVCVWPTAECIRRSTEGWAGGASCPCEAKNQTPEMRARFHRYDATPSGRGRSVPHIKTFSYLKPNSSVPGGYELSWLYTGSHNLSMAAWGQLQKGDTQLFIRSYELGVLFTPATYARGAAMVEEQIRAGRLQRTQFTPHVVTAGAGSAAALRFYPSLNTNTTRASASSSSSAVAGHTAVTVDSGIEEQEDGVAPSTAASSGAAGGACIPMPLPYALPATKYASPDVPWNRNTDFDGRDGFGRTRVGAAHKFQDVCGDVEPVPRDPG